MGLSGNKTKTSSKSSGTATTTPNVPPWIQGPASSFFSNVNDVMGAPTTSTPASPLQTQAFQGASNLSLNPAILQAINGTRGLMNFTPDNVQAGQLRDTDLTPYMNPYTDQVIDTSVRDLDRARLGTISAGQGAATRAGAYGGSRHGIADAETNRGFLDSVSSLVAGLRDSGFRNAQTAALADIGNKMSADTGNADRGVTGAGLRLGASNQLGQQGMATDDAVRQNTILQAGLGETQRDIAEQNDPTQARISRLAQIAQLLGINPSDFIGQTINQSGTSSGTTKENRGLRFGWSPDGGLQIGFG